jgi:hypothetical protein
MILALRIFRIVVPLTALCLLGLTLFGFRLNSHSFLPTLILVIALGQFLRSRANGKAATTELSK